MGGRKGRGVGVGGGDEEFWFGIRDAGFLEGEDRYCGLFGSGFDEM